jgi:hypothetical protein
VCATKNKKKPTTQQVWLGGAGHTLDALEPWQATPHALSELSHWRLCFPPPPSSSSVCIYVCVCVYMCCFSHPPGSEHPQGPQAFLLVLQAHERPSPATQSRLLELVSRVDAGASYMEYVPDNAYVMYATPHAALAMQRALVPHTLRGVYQYDQRFRQSRQVRAMVVGVNAGSGGGRRVETMSAAGSSHEVETWVADPAQHRPLLHAQLATHLSHVRC